MFRAFPGDGNFYSFSGSSFSPVREGDRLNSIYLPPRLYPQYKLNTDIKAHAGNLSVIKKASVAITKGINARDDMFLSILFFIFRPTSNDRIFFQLLFYYKNILHYIPIVFSLIFLICFYLQLDR